MELPPPSVMSAKPRYSRRCRTTFTMGQLIELENMFSKNKYPSWTDRKELASALHLDENIIKTWFKNHRIKWKKQQRQTQPKVPREAPNQTVSLEKEETPLATTASRSSLSPGISDARGPVPSEYPGTEQLNGAGASTCISSWDSQPYDRQEIFLGSSYPPWASILCEIDQFVELYALPGEDDPSDFDQYLFPKVI